VFLLLALFHLGMLAGLWMLAAFWMSGGSRHLPDRIALPFLLGLPLAGWLLGVLLPGAVILLVPVSLAIAFGWSYRSFRAGRLAVLEKRAQTLLNAERQIAEDPANAGAYLARAELLEEDGRLEQARADYQRAFGASERALTRHALADHLERLEHAERAGAAQAALSGGPFARTLRGARVEAALSFAGLLTAAANPAYGAALLSMGLMLFWCRRLRSD